MLRHLPHDTQLQQGKAHVFRRRILLCIWSSLGVIGYSDPHFRWISPRGQWRISIRIGESAAARRMRTGSTNCTLHTARSLLGVHYPSNKMPNDDRVCDSPHVTEVLPSRALLRLQARSRKIAPLRRPSAHVDEESPSHQFVFVPLWLWEREWWRE